MARAKSEQKWHVILIDGEEAEFIGIVTAPDNEAAERRAAETFGITRERRQHLVAQLALQ